jgi:hypothetical protein
MRGVGGRPSVAAMTITSHIRVALAVAALAASAIFAGCSDDGSNTAAVAKGTLVGKVTGSHAYVAVVSDGSRVAGYVCDGDRLSRWLSASDVRDGAVTLRDRGGRVLGAVRVAADRATGFVELDGRKLAFAATPARGEAGLYRQATGQAGEPGFRETGWIVLADGSVRGSAEFIDQESDLVVGPAPKRTAKATQVSTGFTSTDTDL